MGRWAPEQAQRAGRSTGQQWRAAVKWHVPPHQQPSGVVESKRRTGYSWTSTSLASARSTSMHTNSHVPTRGRKAIATVWSTTTISCTTEQ